MEINNSVAVVTGGTSGIGLAVAQLLHAKGAIVVAIARHLNNDLPFEVRQADLTSRIQIEEVIETILFIHGKVDILVNCAAQGMFGAVDETKVTDYQSIIDLNLLAPFLLMQGFIPSMKEQKKGIIINVSAAPANEAIAGMGPYLSTKCALDQGRRLPEVNFGL